MHALLFIGSKREEHERFVQFSLSFTAAQGDPKAVKKLLKEMERKLD